MLEHRLDAATTLTILEDRHAEAIFAAVDANRAHLRAWMPWVDGTRGPEDTRAFVRSTMAQFGARNGLQLGIWHEGAFAGTIGTHAVDWANRKTSIGYWLGAEFQGKGIMTRACKALVGHCFAAYGLNRVEIRCATGNLKSQAIPERLGFQREGVSEQSEWLYDHFVDHVIFGMLAERWVGR